MHDASTSPRVISVIIVNFNGGDLLTECVYSVLSSTVPVEILVSDNGSTDGSLSALRRALGHASQLRIVENGANLGFARANNVVVPMATGDYFLFLNPDCIIRPDTLERMLAVMAAHPEAGMAGCLIRNPDGSEQPGCRRFVPTPWRAFVRVFKLSNVFRNHPTFSSFILTGQPLPEEPTAVEAISGAFMLVRRSAMERVGRMDEGYFLHCEDLDWCMRFRQAGFAILFVPDVEIVHAKGVGSTGHPIHVERYKHRGMIRFYRKFFRHRYPTALMLLVVLAVSVRFAAIASGIAIKNFVTSRRDGSTTPPASLITRAAGTDSAHRPGVIITGATSQIGRFLIPRLQAAGYIVYAISRHTRAFTQCPDGTLVWREIDIVRDAHSLKTITGAKTLIHLAPLGTLPRLLEATSEMGIERVIAFSSTSRFSKLASADPDEQRWVRELIDAEDYVIGYCGSRSIAWTLFRPTLIYGCGLDKNVTTIANFIRHFGFFPILGEGTGLRQPVHAEDLAAACIAVLNRLSAYNRAYNLSGGETLTYRQMVEAIFRALGKKPRIVRIPLSFFSVLVRGASLLHAYRHLNLEMVNRINIDLDFDHQAAARDFGYAPRKFEFSAGPDAQPDEAPYRAATR